MNDLDDNGWGHIHHAAFRGFVKSIERFVMADPEQLEFETGDELHSTPFLLAVTSGSQESVQCLINLDCRVNVVNSQNHGAVELCAMRQYISLLEFLLALDLPQLPVWKNLLKFLSSESEDEAEAAGRCLRTLTDPSSEGVNSNWHPLYMAGGVPTIVKVAKGNIGEEAKIPCTQTLLNIISQQEVQEQAVAAGAVQAYIRLLKADNHFLVQLSAQVLKELARTKSHADLEVQHGVIPALLRVLQAVSDPEVLVQAIHGLGNVGAADPKHQHAIGSTHQLVPTLVGLFEKSNHPDLLLALTQAVGKIARKEKGNQNAFVNEGITPHLVNVLLQQMRNKEIQLSTVEALHLLAEDNSHSQRAILDKGAERLLMQLLKKSRQEALLERTAMALWALAGDDIEQQCKMADGIGVSTLIEFVNSLSENLHYIGSEGLGVLAQGPLSQQTTIAQANGIHPLVRLLRSDKERIVVSVVRTLRALCVGVGNVPHPRNQATISQSRGIKLLIALMVLPRNEELQVEAALTLGYVSLGNADILEEILTNVDFSYVRILKMMYADSAMVRLLAGSALAAFAYNSVQQQRDVAEQGGVRFNCFVPFLRSEDEYYRCNSAYQVVVLSRIIPDEEQAKSSAAGIKLLVDLLQESTSEPIQALAADCIARLAHTRAGVPAAIVAIDAVEHLCKLLLSRSEQVRGCAAIALAYLSYNHGAERQLLNKCRTDPYLMRVLKYYTSRTKLSVNFYEGWKHYKRVGLPAIPEGRPSLLRGGLSDVRPATMLSLEDTPEGSNLRSSHSHLEGDVTGRSSRTSRGSRRSRGSHVSHASQRTASRGSSIQIEAPATQSPLHNGGGELVTAEEG